MQGLSDPEQMGYPIPNVAAVKLFASRQHRGRVVCVTGTEAEETSQIFPTQAPEVSQLQGELDWTGRPRR